MRIQDFLKFVARPDRENFFVVCADDLGLSILLQGALSAIAEHEDIIYVDAKEMTKEKARQIEAESRLGSKAGSKLTHFYIHRCQYLSTECVGPLLKAVEEAKSARFIFQTQLVSRKLFTLMSRSIVVKLPFMSRKMVFANMKAQNYDARAADSLGLYDGTLSGTNKALGMKDALLEIKRELKMGFRGIPAIYSSETLGSLAFDAATNDSLNAIEKEFLRRGENYLGTDENSLAVLTSRKKLVMFSAMSRANGQ